LIPDTKIELSGFHLHCRIRNCLSKLYAKDITPDDKQELDEALQREVSIKPLGFCSLV